MVASASYFVRLTSQPELRTPKSGGDSVCVFNCVQIDRVESPRGSGNWADREPALFMRCTVFNASLAANIVESNYRPGTRVIIDASLRRERDWQDKEGNTRRGDVEVIADDFAVSNRHLTVTTGPPAGRQAPAQQNDQPAAAAAANDPWAQQPPASHPAPAPAGNDPWAAPAASPADPWANN
ncbi:MAG: single-stranded DNA-binding protein [Nocardioides sp.]|nr:single-stranded DNA-binding protein [Nocardioides sp.]